MNTFLPFKSDHLNTYDRFGCLPLKFLKVGHLKKETCHLLSCVNLPGLSVECQCFDKLNKGAWLYNLYVYNRLSLFSCKV